RFCHVTNTPMPGENEPLPDPMYTVDPAPLSAARQAELKEAYGHIWDDHFDIIHGERYCETMKCHHLTCWPNRFWEE
ncbi:MAG: hypothetical protein FWC72_00145, partial [Oscillospiraceae bacterium]|nr:hypothetical protein [Oscillospiraceae bacterium]